MLTVIQRVTSAHVVVGNETIGEIKTGLVALLAIEKGDTKEQAKQLIDRVLAYRIFADQEGKMNLSLRDINGGLLLIPQFTLAANTTKGNRPSFTPAETPTIAMPLFEQTLSYAKAQHTCVAGSRFGTDMQVNLSNDGPVTFILRT
ncbi:MAG: D-tyrosyl-tRNA(Tyr) deacylase [Cycloclasticus sp. symbiont of Poecilosclerida sp. M]|nr:MAG: D-tyrosyl-tRNA(Tyr) deacylase [Cycloclasticus sp. symbiont of Poecilosclerida sp. M]